MRRIGTLLLGLCLMVAMAGCDRTMGADGAADYVSALLNLSYRGDCSAVQLDTLGLTEPEAQDAYDRGLEQEMARFCHYFDIQSAKLTDETKEDLLEMLALATAKARFTVGRGTAMEGNQYAVLVTVRSADLFQQVAQDTLPAYVARFEASYSHVDVDKMSSSDRLEFQEIYENQWASGIITLCMNRMGMVGYADGQTMLVLVTPDKDDQYGMSDLDFTNVCNLILPY